MSRAIIPSFARPSPVGRGSEIEPGILSGKSISRLERVANRFGLALAIDRLLRRYTLCCLFSRQDFARESKEDKLNLIII